MNVVQLCFENKQFKQFTKFAQSENTILRREMKEYFIDEQNGNKNRKKVEKCVSMLSKYF